MKDIAHDLGVSVMTVSKALRNHTDISEQTRVEGRLRTLTRQSDSILESVGDGIFGTDSANAHLYSATGLAAAHASLIPGGTLALWSAHADREFTHRLRAANFTVHLEHTRAHANKGPRHTIYLAQKSKS